MAKSNLQIFLSLLLSLFIANPSGLFGASSVVVSPRSAVGSIESYGAVRVDEILVPSETTLFAGDRVQTNNGGAVVQYRKGVRVSLAAESVADFASARVQLEKGLMRFETSENGVVFAASTLRLEPTAARTVGNVTFRDSKASVSLTEGTLKVVDPSGVQLASLRAGEARMFEEGPDAQPASPSASPQSPSTPSPSGKSNPSASTSSKSNRTWLLAAGAAAVGLTVGLGLGLHGSNSNAANAGATSALGSQAQSMIATITSQLNSLMSQAATLKAQLDSLSASNSQARTLDQQLAAQQALLAQVQTELAALTAQINSQGALAAPRTLSSDPHGDVSESIAKISPRQLATSEEIAELQALLQELLNIQQNIIAIQNAYNALLGSISPSRVG